VGLDGIGVGFGRRASGRPWSGGLGKTGFGIHTNAAGWPRSAALPVHLIGLKGAEVVMLHRGVDRL
jgi:hypothetical protein